MSKIVVTGANGHLGYHLCKSLKKKGYSVVGTIRNINDPKKNWVADDLGIELFPLEFDQPIEWDLVTKNARSVFHCAAPTDFVTNNASKKLIELPVKGMKNLLASMKKNYVRELYFTSSCSTIGMRSLDGEVFTEEDWNQNVHSDLLKGKWECEKLLWVQKNRPLSKVKICTFHPGLILGPGPMEKRAIIQLLKRMVEQKLVIFPNFEIPVVDVRDLAELQVLAFEKKWSVGRFIASAGQLNHGLLINIIDMLFKEFEINHRMWSFKFPQIPIKILAKLEHIKCYLTKKPTTIPKEILDDFLGIKQVVDGQKAIKLLNWTPRTIEETIRDTLLWYQGEM